MTDLKLDWRDEEMELRKKMTWVEFVDYAKIKSLAVPPNQYIQYAHHWWVRDVLYGSADTTVPYILQWSPTYRMWYRSNQLGTMNKPISGGTGLELIDRVKQPPIAPEYDPVQVAIRYLQKLKDGVSINSQKQQENLIKEALEEVQTTLVNE
jgi:hypothetical protein